MALIDKASLLMVPSTYEAGTLYNVLPSGNRAPDSTGENSGYDQTRADFDFDRGSNTAATRIGSDGLIKKYRENFLPYSNNLNGSDWSATRLFSKTTGHSGYDGSNDAWLVIPNSSNNTHYFNQVITSGNGVQTISVYAKAGGYDYFSIRDGSASDTYGRFDLATQTTSTDGSNAIESKMVSVGNDWYRCSLTLNRTAGSSNNLIFYVNNVYSNKPAYVGDEVSGVYFQDFQLESSLVPTDVLTSGATTAKAGVLIDLPRIDYSSGAGALLLEPSRLNKIQYSEYFGDSSWNNSNEVTRSISEATSPEGVLNAYDIIPTTANTNHTLRAPNLSGFTSGAVVNVSFFAKENGYKFISVVGGFGSSSTSAVVFNLEDGTIESGTGTIEDFGNGWYRCVSPITLNATALYCVGTILNDSQSGSFSGDGVKGISVYGYQIEEASYQTSYIPNHGESGGVTRAADSCSVTGVSDVIGQTEGTIYAEVNLEELSAENRFILTIANSSQSVALFLRLRSSNQLQFYSAGLTNNFDIRHSITNGGTFKIAGAYKSGDIAFYVDGTQIGTDSSTFSTPSLTDARLGTQVSTGFELGGGIKEATLFNERLSNAELAALTA